MKLLKRLKVFSTVSKSISTARQLLLSDLGLLRGWQCPGGLHGNHNRLAAPNLCHSNVNRKDGAGSQLDRKSTRLNSSHSQIPYAAFCLTKTTKARRSQ